MTDPAMAYTVWRVDCPCGAVVDYGSDESTIPEQCEECGAPVEKSGM